MQASRRRRRQEARRDLMLAACVFAVLAGVAVAGLWLVGKSTALGPFACAGYEFDPAEWRNSEPSQRRSEARMIARCDSLVGKSRKQVRTNLGDPLPAESNPRRWSYFLGGSNDFLRIGDSASLVIRFNGRGRVTEAEGPDSGGVSEADGESD